MRIAIVAPHPIPFQLGGIEKLTEGLNKAFNELSDHSAEIVKLPVDERTFLRTAKAYSSFRNLNLDHFDLIISLKYPAWMVRHRNHVCYMTHRLRGVYDCFPGKVDTIRYIKELPKASRLGGVYMRKYIHNRDNKALTIENITDFFCISETVKQRQEYFPAGSEPKVIYPPTALEGLRSEPGQYLFTVSRLDQPKRIDLIIEAFKRVKGEIELRIAGDGSMKDGLEEMAASDHRIKFLGFLSDKDLVEQYASSIAVVFVPQQEDFGLITVEAMKSKKPVITCRDSGGPVELVENEKSGFIVEPDVDQLANAMQKLIDNKEYAANLGEAAFDKVRSINWQNTVDQFFKLIEN